MGYMVEFTDPNGWKIFAEPRSAKDALRLWRILIVDGYDSRITWRSHVAPEMRPASRRPRDEEVSYV